MSCSHKTFLDHTTGVRTPAGRNTWVCSHCGAIGEWTDSWSYYGSIECRECQTAAMEWVACSRECAQALNGGTMPREAPIADDRPRKSRTRRARRMTLRDKAAAYDRLVAEGKAQR